MASERARSRGASEDLTICQDEDLVQVGSVVKEGETVCIIEAMKILNEIESDKSGTVKQVLCENGQAVEYGQALYIIE
jgi:acetyl-CoA carboxylase biotin carboxyl carrier protein